MDIRGKGVTLLELIIVIIVTSILAAVGFAIYTKFLEKSRISEAKMILGQIRSAQEAYKQEYGDYADNITNVSVEAPGNCTGTTHYFSYAGGDTSATATRCGTGEGKNPGSSVAYTITVTYSTGVFGGSAGYY